MPRLLFCLLFTAALSAGEAVLSFHDEGLRINAGTVGGLTMEWPELTGGNKSLKPTGKRHQGGTATLTYPDGTVLTLTIAGDDVAVGFDRAPAGIDGWRCNTILPSSLRRGGSWQIGDKSGEFPREKPAKPHLFQGTHHDVRITDVSGAKLLITVPPYSFHQVQDNLEWGWDAFGWWFKAMLTKDHLETKLTIKLDLSGVKSVVLVDEFGQDARREFPGKVHGIADLAKDKADEAAYWASFTGGPALDEFGGFAGSGEKLGLKKTGFFHLERKGGKPDGQWLLVDPAGNAFFQLGICAMGPGEDYTHIKGRTQAYAWLPPFDGEYRAAWHNPDFRARDNFSFFIANNIRKYGTWDPEARWDAMIDRVRAVGFNSSGAFGGIGSAARKKSWPWTPMLPLGHWQLGHQIPGVRGVFDPFDAEVIRRIPELFAKEVAPHADDPLIIGWFLENEQAFEDLPKVVPGLPGKHACKRRLVEELKTSYREIAAFTKAWGVEAASFDILADMPLPVRTDAARADVHRFTGLLIDAYHALIRREYDKVDRNHLLIGNRWQPGTANDEQLVSITAKYQDVISVNYYTYGIDRAFVDRIHRWSGGKPQMWTEFHWGSTAESGPPGRMDLPSQAARGKAYRHYVEGAAATGYVLGIQWFQLIDQPFTGRWFEGLTGEGYAIGLFSVADRPYKDMLAQMAATNRGALHQVWLAGRAPFVFDDPRFGGPGTPGGRSTEAQRPTGAMVMDGAGTNWPGFPPLRLAPPQGTVGNEASIKVSYDAMHLYVLATVVDATPQANAGSGEDLRRGDGIVVTVGGREVVLAASASGLRTFVAGMAPQPAIDGFATATADGKGWVLEAAIPWERLGAMPTPGSILPFDLVVIDGDGRDTASRVAWGGGGTAGRLLLAP